MNYYVLGLYLKFLKVTIFNVLCSVNNFYFLIVFTSEFYLNFILFGLLYEHLLILLIVKV